MPHPKSCPALATMLLAACPSPFLEAGAGAGEPREPAREGACSLPSSERRRRSVRPLGGAR
jgi:hypothetical protein